MNLIQFDTLSIPEASRDKQGRLKLTNTLQLLDFPDLYDRYQVKGHLGHLIRQAAYVDLLPTPARNFKGTVEWLSDELFHCIAER